MNILMLHDRYQQPGGEDVVARAETDMLTRKGHQVLLREASNEVFARTGTLDRALAAARSIWNHHTYKAVRSEIRRFRPDIVHCHNTFPLISPAVYYAAHDEHVAVVQTLHNYRLLCVNAQLFRDGGPCELCVGHSPLPGVVHACYRGSRVASAVVATMLLAHRLTRTWQQQVDRYIVNTQFALRLFTRGGLPPDRLAVKPNFVEHDPGLGAHGGGFALFVGRLSPEKGVVALLEAWTKLLDPVPLILVGDGPLRALVEARCREDSRLTYLGSRSKTEVLALMKNASVLVVPSLWYEGFPMVLAEAFATGLPAIVSNHASLVEIVEDGALGWSHPSGDSNRLALAVSHTRAAPDEVRKKGAAARQAFEHTYSMEANHTTLLGIYNAARQQYASAQSRASVG